MRYRSLGRSGLKVSQICLGSNNFGSQVDEETSTTIVKKALDLGVNFIDTANVYTQGKSEEIIGKAIHGSREGLVIATKVGFEVGQGPNQTGLSRKHILWQVRKSLESLRTEYIDIYYLHRFDSDTSLEETMRTMNDLVREGRVRYVGCSNFAAWQIAKAHGVCEDLGLEKLVVVQPPYSLLRREIERELLPFCVEEGLGVVTYSPLQGGFLTGKYQKDSPPPMGTRGAFNQRFWERVNTQRNFELVEAIRKAASDAGVSPGHLALGWIMKNPAVTAPIVGASKPEQVAENCLVTELNIPAEIFAKLDEVTRPVQW